MIGCDGELAPHLDLLRRLCLPLDRDLRRSLERDLHFQEFSPLACTAGSRNADVWLAVKEEETVTFCGTVSETVSETVDAAAPGSLASSCRASGCGGSVSTPCPHGRRPWTACCPCPCCDSSSPSSPCLHLCLFRHGPCLCPGPCAYRRPSSSCTPLASFALQYRSSIGAFRLAVGSRTLTCPFCPRPFRRDRGIGRGLVTCGEM